MRGISGSTAPHRHDDQTTRCRLNGGGNRQANAALHRVVVARMRGHQPTLTLAYVQTRTREGRAKAEIIRCLKRFVARAIFGYLRATPKPANMPPTAA